MSQQTIVVFRCIPHGTEITRSSCGSRFESVNKKQIRTPPGPRPIGQGCMDCPVGRAHSAGDRPEAWPDGRPIVFHDKVLPVSTLTTSKPKGATTVPRVVAPKPLEIPEALRVVSRVAPEQTITIGLDGADINGLDAEERTVIVPSGILGGIVPTHPLPEPGPGVPPCPDVAPPAPEEPDRVPRVRFDLTPVTFGLKTQTVAQWAEEVGLSIDTIRWRVTGGMSLAEACTTAKAKGGRARSQRFDFSPAPRRLPDGEEPPEAPALDVASPVDALRRAGYVVVSSGRVPAGWMMIVREIAPVQKKIRA